MFAYASFLLTLEMEFGGISNRRLKILVTKLDTYTYQYQLREIPHPVKDPEKGHTFPF